MLEFSQSSLSLRSGHSFSEEGFWWFFSCHFQDSTVIRVCEGNKQNNEQKPGTEVVYSETHWSASCSSSPSKFFWVSNPICSLVVLRCGCWNNHFQYFITVLCLGTSQHKGFPELRKFLGVPNISLLSPHRAWSPKNWVVSPESPKWTTLMVPEMALCEFRSIGLSAACIKITCGVC